MPCCQALDAQARDDVAGATYAELCAIRDGFVAVHELRAHRAEMASYAAALALQARLNREAAVVEANRVAAQGFQDEYDALYEEEAKLREAEQQDAAEDKEVVAKAAQDMYCFSVGNAGRTRSGWSRSCATPKRSPSSAARRRTLCS